MSRRDLARRGGLHDGRAHSRPIGGESPAVGGFLEIVARGSADREINAFQRVLERNLARRQPLAGERRVAGERLQSGRRRTAREQLGGDRRGQHFVERGIGADDDPLDRSGALPQAVQAMLKHERGQIEPLAMLIRGGVHVERSGGWRLRLNDRAKDELHRSIPRKSSANTTYNSDVKSTALRI